MYLSTKYFNISVAYTTSGRYRSIMITFPNGDKEIIFEIAPRNNDLTRTLHRLHNKPTYRVTEIRHSNKCRSGARDQVQEQSAL